VLVYTRCGIEREREREEREREEREREGVERGLGGQIWHTVLDSGDKAAHCQ